MMIKSLSWSIVLKAELKSTYYVEIPLRELRVSDNVVYKLELALCIAPATEALLTVAQYIIMIGIVGYAIC